MTDFQSRYNDTTLVHCPTCSWEGRVMDCRHDYELGGYSKKYGIGEVTAVDYCPKCGAREPSREED